MSKKSHIVQREELYCLVWEQPRTHLAQQFGVSDVAIGKACRKAGIPMPPAGFWARKKAGRTVRRMPLPPRAPGVNDEIMLGGPRYNYGQHQTDKEIMEQVPQPPVFNEPIENVRERIKLQLGKVAQPRSLKDAHRLIAKLLEQDEQRRIKAANSRYVFSWDEPYFDSPTEKRRLRILSGLFKAIAKCGVKPSVSKDAKDVSVTVGDEHVHIELEVIDEGRRCKEKQGRPHDKFRLTIKEGWRSKEQDQYVWEDNGDEKVETMLRDVAEEVVLAGERHYRAHKEYQYEWTLERKQELIEKERQRIEMEARLERERLEKLRQERIQLLLDEAFAHRQACDIREYIARVLDLAGTSLYPGKQEQLMMWAEWAKNQADGLDPIVSGRFQIDDLLE
ncbi:MAG: hypothetical protein JAY67_12185 [Candidatus Thiodiazotropha taylori]|nr:hypothetical protein [Candidatus Thiodiazotropha taylori]